VIEIGKYNLVTVISKSGKGYGIEDRDGDRIFLPHSEVNYEIEIEDEIEVFAFLNNHDDKVASTFEPTVLLGEFGFLKVKSNSNFGSFLDWGVSKDLLVPFNEQKDPMSVNERYIVYCYLDERNNKLAATSKIDAFLKLHRDELAEAQEVEIMVVDESDLGVNVIVNHKYRGLIYHNENFKNLQTGDVRTAFVKTVRNDGKLDIRLSEVGVKALDNDSQQLLSALKEANGFLALTDKSEPDVIVRELEMSKKAFKRSVGALYKQRIISLEDKGIRLL
jgi:predicted RNA-binding protein (virulence factor B family)